jgi:hypothetical protein
MKNCKSKKIKKEKGKENLFVLQSQNILVTCIQLLRDGRIVGPWVLAPPHEKKLCTLITAQTSITFWDLVILLYLWIQRQAFHISQDFFVADPRCNLIIRIRYSLDKLLWNSEKINNE